MEGLAAFVSRFENGKLETCSLREEAAATETSIKDFMPNSSATTSSLLPFSIEEILSDRRGISHANEQGRSNAAPDVIGSKRNYEFPFRGKTGVDLLKNGIYLRRIEFMSCFHKWSRSVRKCCLYTDQYGG